MKDDTEEVQEGIQSPGPAEEVQPASLDEALNSVLDEDQAQRVTVFVEKAPKFKPIKALSASGKMEFAAAVSGMDDIQAQLRNAEFSEVCSPRRRPPS